ncbi:MAG TPA: hypothetical protein VIG51_05300 [Candidatus Baltobacteraceae bacterium]|jgi:hypothetical protein
MSMNTLHVTNGDSVVHLWKKAGLLGTHLPWRDVLHEGPVLGDRPLEEMSAIRAQFLAHQGYGNAIKVHRDFEKRDALIRRASEFEEIVLWFEHDLFDQLQVLQILAVIRDMQLGAGTVQLIHCEHYLGTLSPDEVTALLPKRRSLTTTIASGAQRAWLAFTASTPDSLRAACSDAYGGLPFMQGALWRLCEEFPSLETGISRTQRQILEAVAQGARSKDEIFKRSQAREEAAFLGDASCFREVAHLCAEPAPLLAELESGYELTVLGRRVLAGDADWLEFAPLDMYIGGVHLERARHWRWDETARAFVERAG